MPGAKPIYNYQNPISDEKSDQFSYAFYVIWYSVCAGGVHLPHAELTETIV